MLATECYSVKLTVKERFLAKVAFEPVSGCWLWMGYVDDSGYGVFTFRKKTCGAHRVSWTLHVSDIPPGLFVCHKCDIRCCVNPEHLFLGTARENQADMKRKGRSPFGENSSRAKLDTTQVREIKSLLSNGKLRPREIGRLFGVSTSAIRHIQNGENWRHVSPNEPSLAAPATSTMEEMMADFTPAFEFVMQHEDSARSGKVTVDAGGRTRFGIAEKFHPDLPEEFFTAPAEDALKTAEDIMRGDYWEPMRLSQVANQNLANKLFDMAVNMGIHQAAIYAQRAVNGLLHGGSQSPSASVRVAEDGVIGERTLAAINAADPIAFHQVLCDLSRQHYRHIASINPAQSMFLQGWLKRADA